MKNEVRHQNFHCRLLNNLAAFSAIENYDDYAKKFMEQDPERFKRSAEVTFAEDPDKNRVWDSIIKAGKWIVSISCTLN